MTAVPKPHEDITGDMLASIRRGVAQAAAGMEQRMDWVTKGVDLTEDAEVYEIEFSFPRPPLSANRRGHWSKWAPTIAAVREEAAWLVRKAKIPAAHHATVQLHYAPGHRRKLDAPNLTGTSKPAIDGIVDAGVVQDDSDGYVTELMPKIHRPPEPGPRCWMTIEVTR